MTLSPLAMIILPLLASIVTGILQHPDLPHARLVNALIAAVFFLFTTAICLWLGGRIVPDPMANVLVYVSILSLVFNAPVCHSLQDALIEVVPSPLLWLKKKPL